MNFRIQFIKSVEMYSVVDAMTGGWVCVCVCVSAQPGAGHPLGFSVEFVDESKQLVVGFVLVCVNNDGVEQVTAALLHLPGFLDDVTQLLGLSTTHTGTRY